MFGLGAGEVLIILAFALIFIGPKKLPELAKNLGKGIREFQKAKDDLMNQVDHETTKDDKIDSEHITGVNHASSSENISHHDSTYDEDDHEDHDHAHHDFHEQHEDELYELEQQDAEYNERTKITENVDENKSHIKSELEDKSKKEA